MMNSLDANGMQAAIAHLFDEVSYSLARYLRNILPSLIDDWWDTAVISALSFQQRRRVSERGVNSLESLEFTALLRVLDQNWNLVSTKLELPDETRHFVKEMQTVRNRWVHVDSDQIIVDDAYRDLDTLQRFALFVDCDKSLLESVRELKSSLLLSERTSRTQENRDLESTAWESKESNTEFLPGQIVHLQANPSMRGVVVSSTPGEPENRISVFMEGVIRTFYVSQLIPEDCPQIEYEYLPGNDFHSYLTSLQIQYPGLSTLYSLMAARVNFIPYQFRPVLRFIRSDRPRLLIADGVGVGKTIEAGLILRELQARRNIRSILIICPRPLVTERKWQIEMKRFDESFVHLDGPALRYCINELDLEGSWPTQYQRIIVPYSLFDDFLLHGSNSKQKLMKGLVDLDPPPRFDLVIVDEAHHIRNKDTFSHKAVRYFCDYAEAVIFLTATPIQLGSDDLFVLLNTLRPDLIIDRESFEHMSEPNPFINRAVDLARSQELGWVDSAIAVLDEAADTPWGRAILRHNPDFKRIFARLTEGKIGPEKRVQLITDLEALHTFSGIINRTRRRDIGEFTVRKPESIVVQFTPNQKELHDELLQVQAEIFFRLHGDSMVNFLMTTIRRQAASCLFGLAPLLEEILSRHLDALPWEETNISDVDLPAKFVDESIESRIQAVVEKARNLDPFDPKLDALRNIICNKQKLQNKKVMLFSSFRHTLHYLYQNLKADGLRVGMIHGGTADGERISVRNRFELTADREDCIDVLMLSEIGSEGLDYQFCDCIVNYDLPWNPMRVEQRIGRIDRIGQKSERITIFNLITPSTVDADIYERCLLRIGVFEKALGGSEQILGDISREIRNIAENFNLSELERGEQLQQLADNKIRLVQEQNELEEKQLQLFGIQLPEEQMQREIKQASSSWLSSKSIRRLVKKYLEQSCGRDQDFILGGKDLNTLRLSQDNRIRLLRDFQNIPRQTTSLSREWENWLKGGNPHLLITFDSECASKHPEAVFMTPLHPLVKQAANALDSKKPIMTSLRSLSNEVPKGNYEFAIYQWHYFGIREDLVLQPVASNDIANNHLISLLETAVNAPIEYAASPNSKTMDDLDTQHQKLWSESRSHHRRRTSELVDYRKESLTTSHRARMALLDEQLRQAINEKIKIMRRSQIDAAEADYVRRCQELDIAMERAEITAEPVAYGVIQIDWNTNDVE